ncbi:aspartate--tRNA ligase [Erysipelothrix inopinata]|uniref:Aspartate--tRNA ligase n=1 Tax=Erysipelothrix inopinata TaxID=225084 RepID=A0A7G9RX69_9FIRM|nr:aspartate--tRNA ligase [Erysipelothrix inopinata]QNN60194.1 aspartate--tRNA ligase [Erysipelothrix inopinata]
MNRTHHNGILRMEHVGQEVELVGWVAKRRNFGSINFIDLRDRSGIVQLVVNHDEYPIVQELKNEYVVSVKGLVRERQDKNAKLATGDIEVDVKEVTIINKAAQTPMIIADETDALEDTRLKYRYLDLRRPVMQERLIKRAAIVSEMRKTLDNMGFIDVETPMLTKSTPEGAREYLVPSRVHEGEFYALAQSPQIFKQLLMIGGMERYYQVARCFRDEDLRADRQLDFTQVDIEASFLDQNQFMDIIETIVDDVMINVMHEEKHEIPKIKFVDALNYYGSDKPDLRFEMKLIDFAPIFAQSEFKVFSDTLENGGVLKGLVLKGHAETLTRKVTDKYTDLVKKYGLKGLVALKYEEAGFSGSAAKFISEAEQAQMVETLGLEFGDAIFIGSGEWELTCTAIGALRLQLAKDYNLIPENKFAYCWVVDFPMFEMEDGVIIARHHPFTAPVQEHVAFLDERPLDVIAQAYDLVLNGFEVAGGSMRIYQQELQEKMFEIIGFTPEEIQRRFGFFVDAFKYGTPPHGGIAFGLDRYAMALTHSETIRDVIAFPKNASARCPLTNAPSPAVDKQLKELHLEIVKSSHEE